jgi:hypothetical protein
LVNYFFLKSFHKETAAEGEGQVNNSETEISSTEAERRYAGGK